MHLIKDKNNLSAFRVSLSRWDSFLLLTVSLSRLQLLLVLQLVSLLLTPLSQLLIFSLDLVSPPGLTWLPALGPARRWRSHARCLCLSAGLHSDSTILYVQRVSRYVLQLLLIVCWRLTLCLTLKDTNSGLPLVYYHYHSLPSVVVAVALWCYTWCL